MINSDMAGRVACGPPEVAPARSGGQRGQSPGDRPSPEWSDSAVGRGELTVDVGQAVVAEPYGEPGFGRGAQPCRCVGDRRHGFVQARRCGPMVGHVAGDHRARRNGVGGADRMQGWFDGALNRQIRKPHEQHHRMVQPAPADAAQPLAQGPLYSVFIDTAEDVAAVDGGRCDPRDNQAAADRSVSQPCRDRRCRSSHDDHWPIGR